MAVQDYNPWMGQELKKLIDLITNKAFQTDPDSINTQIENPICVTGMTDSCRSSINFRKAATK